MAQLAIKGHATRGREVIELLEMLGGKNIHNYNGTFNECYVIDNGKICTCYTRVALIDGFVVITLEEFLEKFPYKVGDKVTYDGDKANIVGMVWDNDVNDVFYEIQVCDDVFKCPKVLLQPYKETMEEELMPRINFTEYCKDKYIIDLGNYEIKKENGVTYAIRKKLQYPKTYKECCNIVGGIASTRHLQYDTMPAYKFEEDLRDSLETLRKLIICRNAYWKIAGDWKPEFRFGKKKYCIMTKDNKVISATVEETNRILTFPTAEMQDAFYENFKSLIEECKELL